jgi:hypothetical protein
MIPVNWSTYVLSVSMRSISGLDFLGFPSSDGDGGAEADGEEELVGAVGLRDKEMAWHAEMDGYQ